MYLTGWPMRGSNAASFASAAFLVASSIQAELVMPLARSAPRRFSISSAICLSAAGGKYLRDVDRADRLAEGAVHQLHAALPALALRLHARQRLREKVELRLVERLRQVLGVIADEVIGEIRLHVSTGVAAKILPIAMSAVFCVISTVGDALSPAVLIMSTQSNSGAFAFRPSIVWGSLSLAILRLSSGDHWSLAIAVSSATIASALALASRDARECLDALDVRAVRRAIALVFLTLEANSCRGGMPSPPWPTMAVYCVGLDRLGMMPRFTGDA